MVIFSLYLFACLLLLDREEDTSITYTLISIKHSRTIVLLRVLRVINFWCCQVKQHGQESMDTLGAFSGFILVRISEILASYVRRVSVAFATVCFSS